ncbi:uncharacterized protein N7511_000481 [Penicillium nucicola]|uniref:uncharacterized protein n=1 Tax=Penicillium nucicola TaxID=1850975 RepID=UPI0025457585|nr:uncharacterized protein N7511_000481 [Penicillium nucicola]KAJ5775470.1 hypothetical protein N7511_000481 [Penicillium nucicola]
MRKDTPGFESIPGMLKAKDLLLPEPNGTRYLASAHWKAIMNATRKLKEGHTHTNAAESTDVSDRISQGPFLLLGLSTKISTTDLLAELPSRQTIDVLISRYFNSREPSLIFIHGPAFRDECNEFWKMPTKVSPAWLALLYGVISCAVWIGHITDMSTSGINSQEPELFRLYRKQCALCLTASNYTVPGRYKVEGLALYFGLEYLTSSNLKTSVSILLAICIRLAIMMGYHHDAQSYSHITVFDAEMRRRVWLFLQSTDSIVSWQTGLPRVLFSKLGDTCFPRNLLDEDFGPNTAELPHPRPEIDLTSGVVYMVATEQVLSVTSEITDKISTGTLSHGETVRLSQKLESTKARIPYPLRLSQITASKTWIDNGLKLQQYTLEITIQRATCILHRQYLLSNRYDEKYAYLRNNCVDSARRILSCQADLFQGAFDQAWRHSRVWFGASISISNCLTAAMVICFEIIYVSQAEMIPNDTYRAGLIDLLRSSYDTWKVFPRTSFEISMAADAIATMLKLVDSYDTKDTPFTSVSSVTTGSQKDYENAENISIDRAEAVTLGPFSDMPNGDSEFAMFDWGLWDREMLEINNVIANHISF